MPLVSYVIIPIVSDDGKEVLKYRRLDLVDGSIMERFSNDNEWNIGQEAMNVDEAKWMSSYVQVKA